MNWQTRSFWSKRVVLLLGLAASLGLVGCGTKTSPGFVISGKVTLEGEPVPAGSVYFIPLDGSRPVNCLIKNGNYVCRVSETGYRDCQYVIQIFGFDGTKNPSNQDMGYKLWERSYEIQQKLDPEYREGVNFDLTRNQVGSQPEKPVDPWDVT